MTAPAELVSGVYPGIPMADYLAIKALSSGMAHHILTQSPLHAWIDSPWNPNRKDKTNKASNIGTITHDVLLEGGTGLLLRIDPNDYPTKTTGNIPDGWTNKDIRAARDAAIADGKVPLFPADVDAVTAMVASARAYIADSELAGVFDTGAAEQTVVWEDGFGHMKDSEFILCKARPDWLNADVCLHVKTTARSVNPSAFERMAINMGYDISIAFYARGIERDQHLILAIEQEPPYACKLFGLSKAQEDISARKVERAINTWAACMKAGKFPAYDGSVHWIEPTSWQMEQALQNGDIDGLGYDADIAGEGVQA